MRIFPWHITFIFGYKVLRTLGTLGPMTSDIRDNYIENFRFRPSKLIFPFPSLSLCPKSAEMYTIIPLSAMEIGEFPLNPLHLGTTRYFATENLKYIE